MYQIHGRCGKCGGQVVTPIVWMGIFPPTPTCISCGATAKDKTKTIEMN